MLNPNICIPFDGNHGSIPSRFSRLTAGDGRGLKGWGSANPGDTGGAATHTHNFTDAHTINSHTHTYTTNGGYDDGSGFNDEGSGGGDKGMNDNHTHSGTTDPPSGGAISQSFTSGSASSLPPYYDVIYIKSTSYNLLPPNGIVFRASNSRPGLAQFSSGNGKFFRGADTAGNAGGTGGSLTHNHVVDHSPSAVSHYHFARTTDSGVQYGSNNTNGGSARNHHHDFNFASASDTPSAYTGSMGSADTVQPLYKTLCPFKNTGANGVPLKEGDIAFLADGSDVPVGWVECDGDNDTPDLQDYHIKNYAGDSTANDGTGAGSNSHGHTAANSHSHTAGSSHSHSPTGTGGNTNSPGYLDGAGSAHVAPDGHHHTATQNQSQTSAWASNTISLDTNSNTQPPYLVVKFIMFQFASVGFLGVLKKRMRS